jgi:hypothetical protein
MYVLDAMPETECVSGNLIPTAIPHILNRELSPEVRQALIGTLPKALSDYLESGAYNARTAALRKWAAAGGGLGRAISGKRHSDRIVYKEPFLALAPEYPYEALPEARIVVIHRDGRDVADSLVRSYDVLTDEKLTDLQTTEAPIGRRIDDRYVPWWVAEGAEREFLDATPYVRAAWLWKEMVRRCDGFFARADVVAGGRVLQLRYEELVRDPAGVGRRLAEHVDGPVTSRMRKRLTSAHTRSIGVHRQRDPVELEAAERIAGDELRRLGYLET